MNGCDRMEERLNDLVDGLLSEAEAADVSRHLEGCEGCRRSLEELRRLKESAAALPPVLSPERDLWPGIEAGLSADRPSLIPRTPRRTTPWGWPLGLAAAAIALVAITASITMVLIRPGGRPPARAAASGTPGTAVLASYRQAESEYLRATDALQAALDERREELAPETLAQVDENLRVIDAAIGQIRTALESDPGHAVNRHLFTALYQKKVTLLQQANRLPAEGRERGAS